MVVFFPFTQEAGNGNFPNGTLQRLNQVVMQEGLILVQPLFYEEQNFCSKAFKNSFIIFFVYEAKAINLQTTMLPFPGLLST